MLSKRFLKILSLTMVISVSAGSAMPAMAISNPQNDVRTYEADEDDDDFDWELSDTKLTIDAGVVESSLDTDWGPIQGVTSSNPSVVSAKIDYNGQNGALIILTKKGKGKSVITVTGEDGSTKTCNVTCKMAPFKFKTVKFNKKNCDDTITIYGVGGKEWQIKNAVSSKPKVASVKLDKGGDGMNDVVVTAKKPGTTVVTIKNNKGQKAKVKVIVAKNWTKANLNLNTNVTCISSEKEATVGSRAGATVTFKIGRDTYKTKIGKKGYKIVKLKKKYKFKTKIKVQAKYKKITTKKTTQVWL